jgi:hypothetical protein
MSDSAVPPRRLIRSVLALLAGFVVILILSIATDLAMRAIGVLPAPGQPPSNVSLLVAFAYRTIYAIAGSYVVARLAPYRPMQHSLVSGLLGLVVSIAGAIVTWNGGPEFGAKWYPLALIAVTMPCAWIGGKLFTRGSPGVAYGGRR